MVLFVGELLIDLITQESFENSENYVLKIGGSPGNIAKYLSMLGVSTRIVSKLGNDPLGEKILASLENHNVDISYIQIDNDAGTTIVFVQKTPNTPDFFVMRGADSLFDLPNPEVFNGIKIMHLSCWPISRKDSFEKTLSLIEQAVQRNIEISFDPNCRDKLFDCRKISIERIKKVLSISSYSKPSLDDAAAIFGEINNEKYSIEDKARHYIEQFRKIGVKNIVLTAGKYGAYILSNESKETDSIDSIKHIPSHAKNVVDATGAGDGFWAGIYYGLLKGDTFLNSCELGSKIAAYILGFTGADVCINRNILEG